ncbi:15274_t:CDS:1 [Gigaspora margarita]|uniref:15274_t:CDS:1 n=1 Tax=Gigaspora margarita TaxID=4874 RepID=A0ABN7UPV1_GIGMA|nr:15274_t:CDS:1 [Gigaspora margarita]
MVNANDNWENCFIDGLNVTGYFDIQFNPDPIYSPGPRVTTFKIKGDIGNLGASHGNVFSNYAELSVNYVSDPEGNNPAYLFPVPPGQKQFEMEVDIATHSSVFQNHVIKFRLTDLGEDIGCVKFRRNAFTH